MGRLLEVLLLRGFLWVGLPFLLVVLAVGPGRCWDAVKSGWHWLWRRRLDPEEVLGKVVSQYKDLVEALNRTLAKSREAEAEIQRNIKKSEDDLLALEGQARAAAERHDDLEAKALLYKMGLERTGLETFRGQLERQKIQFDDLRKHLYLGELQLRQYEVGRSILLSQLAEAQTAEQQYAIASQFDPFSAVANWKQAENMVEEEQLNARAVGRVYADLMQAPLAATAGAAPADQIVLEDQLRQLKERLRATADGLRPAADERIQERPRQTH